MTRNLDGLRSSIQEVIEKGESNSLTPEDFKRLKKALSDIDEIKVELEDKTVKVAEIAVKKWELRMKVLKVLSGIAKFFIDGPSFDDFDDIFD